MPCLLSYPASATGSMLTFKLLPRCGPRDEQKCHCVMTNKQWLYPILILLFIGQKSRKVHLHFKKKNVGLKTSGTQRTAGLTLENVTSCHEIKVNPLKATRFFGLCELFRARTHTQKPSGHSLFEQHVPIKSYLPFHTHNSLCASVSQC